MKKILLIISFLLLTGCVSKYSLVYEDGIFKESVDIIVSNNEMCDEVSCSTYLESFFKSDIGIKYSDNVSNNIFYNKELIYSNNNHILTLYHDYSDNSISESYLIHNLFNKVYFSKSEIKASNIKDVFKNYLNLDKIVISFRTDKHIKSTNSDYKKDNIYYWEISKENFNDKSIEVIFDVEANNNELYIENNKISWGIIRLVLLVLLLCIFVGILFVYEKVKNSNK